VSGLVATVKHKLMGKVKSTALWTCYSKIAGQLELEELRRDHNEAA